MKKRKKYNKKKRLIKKKKINWEKIFKNIPELYINIFAIFSIVVITILIYSNVLNGKIIFDDDIVILNNPNIRNLNIDYLLTTNRPLGYLSFAFNYFLDRYNTFGYHLFNIFIHIINAVLIFYLIQFISKTPLINKENFIKHKLKVAFLTSLIFVVHPIQTQAVSYITQRFEPMSTTFFLASILTFVIARLHHVKNKLNLKIIILYTCVPFFFVLALMTKETAVTLPFVLISCELCFFPFSLQKLKKIIFTVFLLIIFSGMLIFLLRYSEISLRSENQEFYSKMDLLTRETRDISRENYFYTQLNVIRTYIRLLILPINQNLDYDYPISTSILEFRTFLSLVFLMIIVIFAFFMKKYSRLIFFGIIWFFITLLPTSSLFPIRDVIFEHRVYLPSIGFILSLVVLIDLFFNFVKKSPNFNN